MNDQSFFVAGSACFPESLFKGGSTGIAASLFWDERADGVATPTLLAGVVGACDIWSTLSCSKRFFAALGW